jgi:hypothetical protein
MCTGMLRAIVVAIVVVVVAIVVNTAQTYVIT